MHREASVRENILTPHADELDKKGREHILLHTVSVFVVMLWSGRTMVIPKLPLLAVGDLRCE